MLISGGSVLVTDKVKEYAYNTFCQIKTSVLLDRMPSD